MSYCDNYVVSTENKLLEEIQGMKKFSLRKLVKIMELEALTSFGR